jgi:hypothetical protein
MPATALGCHPRPSSTDLPTSTLHRKSSSRRIRPVRGPADLAHRADRRPVAPAVPGYRAGRAMAAGRAALAGTAGTAGMSPADRASPAGMAGMGPATMGRAAPGVTNPAGRVRANQGCRDLAVRDLAQNRAHLGRAALSQAHTLDPDRTRVHPHRMPVHLQDRTRLAAATRRPVPIRLAEAVQAAEAATQARVRTADAEGT